MKPEHQLLRTLTCFCSFTRNYHLLKLVLKQENLPSGEKTIQNDLRQCHYYPYFRLSFGFTTNRKMKTAYIKLFILIDNKTNR